jgi:class 3 adenylate cyclase/tetratricopeptide (TPR) repeat protein
LTTAARLSVPAEAPAPVTQEIVDERNASVVFADISGFTLMSATREAGDVFFFVSEWYDQVRVIARKYEAHMSRSEGDCVMLVLGAPTACEDHADRACRLALELRDTFATFVSGASAPAESPGIHVGVNTGPVAAGRVELGSGQVFDILGTTVNEARRLQQAAGPGGIYVGAPTYERAGDAFEWRELPAQTLKGLDGPRAAYALMGAHRKRTRPLLASGGFVGRTEEMAFLRRRLEAAKEGMGQTVLITGEAGIGKSRLSHEFLREAASHGCRVVVAKCFVENRGLAYDALAQIVLRVLHMDDASEDELTRTTLQEALGRLGLLDPEIIDSLARVLGTSSAPIADAEASEKAVRRDVRRVLLAVAEEAPLIVLCEDVQWMDSGSSAVLEHLVPWITAARVMLLGTSRPTEDVGWRQWGRVEAFVLGPLSRSESEALVRYLTETRRAGRLAEAANRSGGNPLFIEELVRAGTSDAAEAMPDTVRDLIMSRIDRLATCERLVLGAAAIVGARFRIALVERMVGSGSAVVHAAIEALTAAGWVRPVLARSDDVCEFEVVLVREVAYSSLTRRDRMNLHRRAAEALVADTRLATGEDVEVLARHLLESDEPVLAAPYLLQAMERAQARAAHQSVLHFGLSLMGLLERDRDALGRRRLEMDAVRLYADACSVAGRKQEALRLYERYRAIAEDLKDAASIARGRFCMGLTYYSIVVYDRAIAEITAAMEAWSGLGDVKGVAMAQLGLGAIYAGKGEVEAALEAFRACWDPASGYGDEIRAIGHQNYADISTRIGRVEEALEHFEQAESLSEGSPDLCLLANIQGGRAQAELAKGQPAKALEVLDRAYDLARQTGDIALLAEIRIDQGQCHRARGDWARARELAEEGIALARDSENPSLLASGTAHLARVLLLMGSVDEALALAEKALEEARALEDREAIHLCRRVLADGAEYQGLHDDARALRTDTLAMARSWGRRLDEASDLADLGASYLALGEVPRALECLEEAVEIARKTSADHLRAAACGRLAGALIAAGSFAEALARATEGVECAAAIGNPDLGWRCHYAAGMAAERLSDPRLTRRHRDGTVALLRDLGPRWAHNAAQAARVEAAVAWAESLAAGDVGDGFGAEVAQVRARLRGQT